MDAEAKLTTIQTLIKERSSYQEINKRAIQASLLVFPPNKTHSVILSSMRTVATHLSISICLCRCCTDRTEPSSAQSPLSYLTRAIQIKTCITKATQPWSTVIRFPSQNAKAFEQWALAEVTITQKCCFKSMLNIAQNFVKLFCYRIHSLQTNIKFGHCKRSSKQ